jgi:hypothetical protein
LWMAGAEVGGEETKRARNASMSTSSSSLISSAKNRASLRGQAPKKRFCWRGLINDLCLREQQNMKCKKPPHTRKNARRKVAADHGFSPPASHMRIALAAGATGRAAAATKPILQEATLDLSPVLLAQGPLATENLQRQRDREGEHVLPRECFCWRES